MKRNAPAALLLLVMAAIAALFVGAASAQEKPIPRELKVTGLAPPSGVVDFREANFGNGITECPQARINTEPRPLDKRQVDEAEKVSNRGDDRRTNTEYSCFPQNETSIGINPKNSRNIVAAQNDYRLGFGSSGIDATVDGGRTWYDLIAPFPSLPSGDNLDAGGDPIVFYDRDGVAYYGDINFNRTDDTNGVWVRRSTNGGFTWSRPCVAIGASDATAVCGGLGDPRQPGDGTVVFQAENINNPPAPDFSVTFHDKPYGTAGPRPAGVQPVCFTPITRQPTACKPAVVGVDRLYITWTSFTNPVGTPGFIVNSTIQLSFSDDQGRSWSPPKTINGSAPFCAFSFFPGGNACSDNQASVPTVNQTNGLLGVAFENFNTPHENQYLFVRSTDGGETFAGPFFVTPVFDVNFPRSGNAGGRPDCAPRGQQNNRIVYTNSCFRSNAYGNVVADRRGGGFADDFYLVMSDNRNGTRASSNADIFLFKSVDGGATWIGPSRVNNDRSDLGTVDRDSATPGNFGNDQWWPWVAISNEGDLNIELKDRRLDTDSTAHEWPSSRQRPGNYLVWTWAAQCRVTSSTPSPGQQCVAPDAAPIPQPTLPINPGSGLQPGQGPGFVGPYRNFQVSDVPSNYDYSFRAGIFAGDYENIAVSTTRGDDDDDDGAFAAVHFTDARNGRSSGNVTSPAGAQPGRNPACEQSDVFFDTFNARNGGNGGEARSTDALFLVTPCPGQAVDPSSDGDDDPGDGGD